LASWRFISFFILAVQLFLAYNGSMMTKKTQTIPIYLEIGQKKVAAGALDWPGWCRIAKGREEALQALYDYSPRYAQVLVGTGLDHNVPQALSALQVVEELKGTTTTDFGVPDIPPSADSQPLDQASLERLLAIAKACWQAFDAAVRTAEGKQLRLGPRGGGRDVEKMQQHVLGAEQAYLGSLAWKYTRPDDQDLQQALDETHQQVRLALAAALRGELPESGPRGGKVWAPRYFVRRMAWHVLDHAWEIEDRT
jgi:hypothetical protein